MIQFVSSESDHAGLTQSNMPSGIEFHHNNNVKADCHHDNNVLMVVIMTTDRGKKMEGEGREGGEVLGGGGADEEAFSMAAWATAVATTLVRRGSKGFGIRLSAPNDDTPPS